jgi:hypothetical protein
MPYIPNEEEQARIDANKAEHEEKQKQLNAAFLCLTEKQQEAIRDMWKAYDAWDTQTSEDWLLYNTYVNLKDVRGAFYQAFPSVTQREED